MKYRPTRALTVIGAALVLMIGGAVTYAAIPSADKVFTACVTKTNGAVRLIDTEAIPAQTCKSSEFRTTWNQAGQPGTAGANGVSGYQVVDQPFHETNVTGGFVAVFFEAAYCPTGMVPMGGGASFSVILGNGNAVPGMLSTSNVNHGAIAGWVVSVAKRDGSVFASDEGVAGIVSATCVTAN